MHWVLKISKTWIGGDKRDIPIRGNILGKGTEIEMKKIFLENRV